MEGRGKGARKRQGTTGIPPLPKPKAASVSKKSVVEEELVSTVEPSESEGNSENEDNEEEDSDGSQRHSRNQIVMCPESEEENDNTDDDNSNSGKTETVTKKKTPSKELPKEKKAEVVKAAKKDKGQNFRKLPAVPAGLGLELVTSPVLAVKSKQPQKQGIFLFNDLNIM